MSQLRISNCYLQKVPDAVGNEFCTLKEHSKGAQDCGSIPDICIYIHMPVKRKPGDSV